MSIEKWHMALEQLQDYRDWLRVQRDFFGPQSLELEMWYTDEIKSVDEWIAEKQKLQLSKAAEARARQYLMSTAKRDSFWTQFKQSIKDLFH